MSGELHISRMDAASARLRRQSYRRDGVAMYLSRVLVSCRPAWSLFLLLGESHARHCPSGVVRQTHHDVSSKTNAAVTAISSAIAERARCCATSSVAEWHHHRKRVNYRSTRPGDNDIASERRPSLSTTSARGCMRDFP